MSAFRHFVSAESLIAVLARRIGIDPNDLAYQWQIEQDGEFKGVVLFRSVSREEADAIEGEG